MWKLNSNLFYLHAFLFCSSTRPVVPHLTQTLTLCEDKLTSNSQVTSRFNQLALFTKRSQQLLTGFQIEHSDTGSSLLAKLALKPKMLRTLLQMCELIRLSMVFFRSFEYGGLGSIIHYSWISLCGESSISKWLNITFRTTGSSMNATWMLQMMVFCGRFVFILVANPLLFLPGHVICPFYSPKRERNSMLIN